MSALREAMSHAVLGWVKPELDETLRLVRQEIEAFVETPADTSRMRFCAGYLHQVQGTLRMVELYAPAMVAEELELLAKALQEGGVADRDEACSTLMRGAVLLPDYLERLQDGHRDIPIVLLPLLNEIRASRGASGLNESMLFPPGARDDATPSEAEIDHARSSLSGRNRELLDTVGNAVKEELLRVKDALDLHLRTGSEARELESQVAELGNVADTLGMMGLGVARDVVMQQRDTLREVVAGARPADEGTLLDVAGALLYVDASLDDQVAHLGSAGDAAPDPSTAESQRTVEVLAQEAIINFAGARERFVAFIETNWDHAELTDVPRLLDEVAGALRMLELAQAGDYVIGVRRYVSGELIGKKRVPGGQQLDTLADAMASLEYYLEALRERRPNREDILEITRGSLEALRYWPLPPEASAVEEASSPASAAPIAAPIAEVPVVEAPVADGVPVPLEEAPAPVSFAGLSLEPIDAAPAVSSPGSANPFDPVGFEEAHGDAETASPVSVLEDTVAPVVEAGDAPVAGDHIETLADVSEATPDIADTDADTDALPDLRHEIAAAAAALPATGVVGGFDGDATDIDDEIRDVFLEEFDEEIVNLRQLLPAWRSNPEDFDRLRPIRRVFHTLKGSGRLVGAKTLGEFSWKVENMLNRVLDRTRAPSHAVEALLEQACDALPQLNAALRGQGSVTADLAGLQDVADRLAAGEEAYYSAQPTVLDEEADFVEPTLAQAAAPVVEDVPAVFEPETEGTPASVDAVLREILETEVDNHLDTVDTWLQKAQVEATPVTEELLRAVHTMNGALAMADVPEITDITSSAEQYVKRLLSAGETPAPEGVAALADTAQAIRRSIAALQAPSPRIPVFAALAGQLAALRDSLPDLRHGAQIVDDAHQGTYVGQMPTIAPPVAPSDIELSALDLSAYLDSDAANGAGDLAAAGMADDATPEDAVVDTADAAPDAALQAGETAPVDVEQPASQGVTFYDIDYRILPRARQSEVDHAPAPAGAGEDAHAEVTDDAMIEMGSSTVAAASLEASVQAQEEDAFAEPIDDALVVDADLPAFLVETEAVAVDTTPVLDDANEDVAVAEGTARVDDITDANELADFPVADAPEAGEPDPVEVPGDVVATADASDEIPSSADAADAPVATLDHDVTMDDAALPVVEERDSAEQSAEAPAVEGISLEEAATEEPADVATGFDATVEEPLVDDAVAAEHAPVEDVAEPVEAAEDAEALEAAEQAPSDVVASVEVEESAVTSAPADMPEPEEALDLTGLDLDLVEIFIEEGNDLLDHSDDLIAKLRETPEDRALIIGLQRDLHTLKGGARMAGIHAVGDLGHAIESMLESIAGQRTELDRRAIQLLERGFDTLHAQLARVTARRAVAIPDGMIAEFNARARGIELPDATTAADASTAPVELAPLSAPIETEVAAPVEEEFFPMGQQEQVRVRADLLDRLVNNAGEVAIYRARLEQQLGAFRGAMAELDRTNIRMHDQLRRLDLETEAQIVARYQREHDKQDPTFDPLELDRFSTLQQLSRALAESAADISGLQGVLDDLARQYDGLLQQQSRVSSELQDGLMRARMLPFEGIVPRLRRVLRQAATETHKQVSLQFSGTHGEMDRNVLDRMTAPLEHLLRNSVAHGLESPKERRKAGKPEEGTVHVALRREGSEMVLEVSDDGAGLNRDAIRKRAEQRGLLQPGAVLPDSALDRLILEPGFSTYDQVSQLAGRGVGMDVVYNEVRQLGGSLEINSVPGKGATFTLRLPQTLAVSQAVFVQIGETQFAVPVAAVSGIGRISHARFSAGAGSYHYAGEDYPLYNLGHLVGQGPAKAEGQPQVPLLLVRAGDLRAAVAVDQVLGNREIVVKPVGPQIASIPGIYGATITGDGSVVVILDAAPLVRRHLAQPQQPTQQVAAVEQRRVPLVMVVDDSLTMRKVTSRVLERHNFEVSAARDGVEALEKLEERVPDLMLLDIEMPRMDGYELATAMKADPRFRDVPIVMITSRTGDKHRQRAFDIGVQRYLGKPYQELDLMRNVYDLLGIARVRE
ncbi:chemosensory pili system protein ChpA (sensor histidine kinase/response regulator) [Pseudoxanthomonas sp. 3HH-4]|uniref:Hpt domain-containing protein n=1 Tax=Pseudoxanthomonas sp. 3HH-4 TaxID=1690214 RepID=UPI001150791F|nr:Hpt domain-containing protein [Pseudoxanthomonas sp. 3HH-4]TQM06858.1 chemosensory pili system protein ChpA (sensor histidine kinase/response regulator) [Pseudoxanthomonas sp. 3HH-4]